MFDGIAGLAGDNLSSYVPTFLMNLHSQGIIEEKSFSVFMNIDGQDTESAFIFGGTDEKYYTGDITYMPLSAKPGYYQISVMWAKKCDSIELVVPGDSTQAVLTLTQNSFS